MTQGEKNRKERIGRRRERVAVKAQVAEGEFSSWEGRKSAPNVDQLVRSSRGCERERERREGEKERKKKKKKEKEREKQKKKAASDGKGPLQAFPREAGVQVTLVCIVVVVVVVVFVTVE